MESPLRMAFALVGLLAACDGDHGRLDWRFVFVSPGVGEDAELIVAEVRAGGCDGPVVDYQTVLRPTGGGTMGSPPLLPPGMYGLAGRALDSGCRVIATD